MMFLEYKDISSIIEPEKGFTEEYVSGLRKKLLSAFMVNSKIFRTDMEKNGVAFDADISESRIDQVIVDAVQDLKRLKDFHPLDMPNTIKEACYLAYWCIKQKTFVREKRSFTHQRAWK